jgi:hypothetical protein
VLAAAADLDLFSQLDKSESTAQEIARVGNSDPRATAVLLDALTALGLIEKHGDSYAMVAGVREYLIADSARSILPMLQHQANCLRRWAQLTNVVKTGEPTKRSPSIRGEEADYASFVGAMDNICAPVADKVVEDLGSLDFEHLLDVGGASGTWTLAFLRKYPLADATIFDLPHVIPLAKRHLSAAGISNRVKLVGGDFETEPLPRNADLTWVSAIIHQNSRKQNRKLFQAVFDALADSGHIMIRDVIMEESRTLPSYGALFAINMLVATQGGQTFTLQEIREDLEAVGFRNVTLLREDEGMNAVVSASKQSRT